MACPHPFAHTQLSLSPKGLVFCPPGFYHVGSLACVPSVGGPGPPCSPPGHTGQAAEAAGSQCLAEWGSLASDELPLVSNFILITEVCTRVLLAATPHTE